MDSVRKYVTEAIGTFFLVITVICALGTGSPLAPLGIGAALMVMIYAGGHISGAHYNPAVSIAAFIRGRLTAIDLGLYVVSQFIGAVLAAGIGRYLFEVGGAQANFSGAALWHALVVELLFTFALAFVVLNVATSKDHPNNSFYGLAIGFTVAAGAIAVGHISGAVFNPAVAVGISVADITSWADIWVYFVAQIIGGALAGVAFRFLNPDDLDAEVAELETVNA